MCPQTNKQTNLRLTCKVAVKKVMPSVQWCEATLCEEGKKGIVGRCAIRKCRTAAVEDEKQSEQSEKGKCVNLAGKSQFWRVSAMSAGMNQFADFDWLIYLKWMMKMMMMMVNTLSKIVNFIKRFYWINLCFCKNPLNVFAFELHFKASKQLGKVEQEKRDGGKVGSF